ncbi:metal ABC transporter ATP-binding protein [Brooklawnia cerclae]|uniref:Zinc/manganese transport system ATP-binding protein n=1 Tax=Brooklawnia cerclae TaxID=349934 RepID=A0ABX0SHW6_9ACTN|nr:zinc/manganese transport system ATP-binding protein [Brooklawnia cerclae]
MTGDTAQAVTRTRAPRGADDGTAAPVLRIRDAALSYGARRLWSGLSLDLEPGEFLTVLGANGTGKTTLLRAVLGLQPLSEGTVSVDGRPARRGSPALGYVPQQRPLEARTPLRAGDIVRQGLDGHRLGPWLPSRSLRRRVEQALDEVGALEYADMPVGLLSGGEQQRVRIAQALVSDPVLLLCDELLLSLDLNSQRTITWLIDQRRRERGTAVMFVTHDINPVLPYTDRVLYLAGGRFRIGTPDDVLTSATLSELYDAPVEVIRSGGRILVAGVPEGEDASHAGRPTTSEEE